jgi:hypothetical protein
MTHSDIRSPQFGSFDASTFEILAYAFDDAWRSLEVDGVLVYLEGDADLIRDRLAMRIVDAARRGERDWRRLRAGALHHVATR